MQSNAVALSVCALQNVSIHLVCIMYFLLLFGRPLDSPTQSILRCLLAEYLGDAQLNKSLTKVEQCFQHLITQTMLVFFLTTSYFTTCSDFGLVQELLWE